MTRADFGKGVKPDVTHEGKIAEVQISRITDQKPFMTDFKEGNWKCGENIFFSRSIKESNAPQSQSLGSNVYRSK